MNKLFIGVDFDGTIVSDSFPHINKNTINERVVELMRQAKEKGHVVIVWTARSGKYEQEALQFLIENNIPFSYMNENPEDEYAMRGEQGRKLFCHYYLDDRAVHVSEVETLFKVI